MLQSLTVIAEGVIQNTLINENNNSSGNSSSNNNNVDDQNRPKETVYRGDSSSNNPSKVFENGFNSKGTNNDLMSHVKHSESGNYVSTSKKFEIASEFAGKNGYIYEIYTNKGIDVNETLGTLSPYPEQFEVSIPKGIPSSDIKGAWQVSGYKIGEYIPNPKFGGK